jgi:hypothetical protein
MGAGQFLSQLDNGAIAVIDPTLPTISSTAPPPPTPISTPTPVPAAPVLPDPHYPEQLETPDPETGLLPSTAGDFPDVTPETEDIPPSATQFQYDSENAWLHSTDVAADGQAVAVFLPPTAKDGGGGGVPASISIAGPGVISVTTSHRSGAESYPVMTSSKTVATKPSRHQKVAFQFDAQQPEGLTASNANGGAPTVAAKLHAHQTRFIMTGQNSCDRFDGHGEDLSHATWDGAVDSNRCQAAVAFLIAAHNQGYDPLYVTIKAASTGYNPRTYARSVSRLWTSYPFTLVKLWGATNEPELSGIAVSRAAETWRAVNRLAVNKRNGCAHCRIAAGEFAAASRAQDAYALQYIDYLKDHRRHAGHKESAPFYWALHDYADVTYQEYHHDTTRYTTVEGIQKRIAKDFGQRPRLWLSEQGVLLQHGGSARTTAIYGDVGAQRKDAKRFLKLAIVNQVSQVAYYEFFGYSKDDQAVPPEPGGFDSGLVRPAKPRDPLEASTIFRPAYCVFTGTSVCSSSTGN